MEKESIRDKIANFAVENSGKILGVIVGFVIGFLFLFLGFWKTLLVVICVAGGYIVGMFRDAGVHWRDVLDHILPPGLK